MSRKNFAKLHGKAVLPNQEWFNTYGYARVLAVSDGWVMLKRKGCVPFVLPVKELDERWQLGNGAAVTVERTHP